MWFARALRTGRPFRRATIGIRPAAVLSLLPMPPQFDLTSLDGLLAVIAKHEAAWEKKQPATLESGATGHTVSATPPAWDAGELGEFDGTFCTKCGDFRRMRLTAADTRARGLGPRSLRWSRRVIDELAVDRDFQVDIDAATLADSIGTPPPVFTAQCLQCRTTMSLVVDAGPPTEVVVLGAGAQGVATPNAPEIVRFYLDQAYRARSHGAATAAIAMYRSALEAFLDHQQFPGRTLAAQIDGAVKASPPWIEHLDDQLMHALRKLGNAAVHPGECDPPALEAQYRELVPDIEHLFLDVLTEVYEIPAQRAARRARIRGAS